MTHLRHSLTPSSQTATPPSGRRWWRLRVQAFLAMCVALPWLMGQSTCFLRSPLISKKNTYGQNAQQLYKYGRGLLKGGNFQEARKAFQRIKTKYPFSTYATLAELGISDSFFKAGKFLRAIDLYKLFAKLHPTHPKAGYASFQVGEGYEKLRPWDWFLVPPSYEKDSTHIKQSIQAFKEFIERFPKHKLVPKAREKMLNALNLMAKHELSVANYYARKGRHRAVVWRMEFLLKKYPKVAIAAEARFRKAEALSQLKRYSDAETAFQEVVKLHPKSNFAQSAKGKAQEMKRLQKVKKPTKKTKDAVIGPDVKKPTVRPVVRPVVRPKARPKPSPVSPPFKRKPKAPPRVRTSSPVARPAPKRPTPTTTKPADRSSDSSSSQPASR